VTPEHIGWLLTTGIMLILLLTERRRARARLIRDRLQL
jgi:hypothetical protein